MKYPISKYQIKLFFGLDKVILHGGKCIESNKIRIKVIEYHSWINHKLK